MILLQTFTNIVIIVRVQIEVDNVINVRRTKVNFFVQFEHYAIYMK